MAPFVTIVAAGVLALATSAAAETDCSAATTRQGCDDLGAECSYDGGYRRHGRWIRKPSCHADRCDDAPGLFACNGVSSQVCKFSSGVCAEVTECADANGAGMCDRLTGCSYDKGYKRFRKWIRKPSCFSTPANCAAATIAVTCNAVTAEVCKFSDGACAEVTECADANGAGMCDRLSGCTYDQGWRRRGRWIRKPACITTPATCADTRIASLCVIVDANCAMIDGACTEVTSCGQAPNQKTCDGVGTCSGWVAGKWVKFGRRKKWVKAKCTPGPTSAPTTAAPTTAAPTDAPTPTPFTDAQCGAFDFDKTGCQGKADRGCVWNAKQVSGLPSVKLCTDGRDNH